jgi:hypothetical protein
VKLHLGFELDLMGLAQPAGEMLMDVEFYASDGEIKADIKELSFCDNTLLDALGKMFGKAILADEIARVINETVMTLPQRDPRIKRIEILNPPVDGSGEAAAEVDCRA